MGFHDNTPPMAPREYLLSREWDVNEDRDSYVGEIPGMDPWTDPVYEQRYDLAGALVTQLMWDVERLGGFEVLVSLSDATGRELEF